MNDNIKVVLNTICGCIRGQLSVAGSCKRSNSTSRVMKVGQYPEGLSYTNIHNEYPLWTWLRKEKLSLFTVARHIGGVYV
jgi:hypothetical protein